MKRGVLPSVVETEGKQLYLPRAARVVEAKQVSEKEKLLRLRLADGSALGHGPGQFVEVSVYGTGECPISVSSSPTRGPEFELVVRKVGNVTTALHGLAPDDKVGVRGPFGRGFDTELLKGKDIVFVGGGIGMVPLRSLIDYVLDRRADYGKVSVLYGCREPGELIFPAERERWESQGDVDYHVTVDRCCDEDRWEGNVGVITTLMPEVAMDPAKTWAVVVGPPVMYKFVIRSLKEKGLADDHIILSLEAAG